MKNIIYILVAILAFFGGFALFKLRPLVIPIPLCEALENTELYQGKEIHIGAFLTDLRYEDDLSIINITDVQKDCWTWISLYTSEEIKRDENLKRLIKDHIQKNKVALEKRMGGAFCLEVEIVGTLERVEKAYHGPPFIIRTKEIKQTSPERFVRTEDLEYQRF